MKMKKRKDGMSEKENGRAQHVCDEERMNLVDLAVRNASVFAAGCHPRPEALLSSQYRSVRLHWVDVVHVHPEVFLLIPRGEVSFLDETNGRTSL